MRTASATPFRESFDFTPKGNRAERVQTVNGSRQRIAFRFARYLSVSAHLISIDVKATKCDKDCPFGIGKRRPEHVMGSLELSSCSSSMFAAAMAARKISSAVMRLRSRASA